jgi:toxin ParE1/3/4
MMTFDFYPEAEKEFLEAIEYYEDCSEGLGEDFSMEVYATVKNILSYSQAWPILEDNVRRCLTNRFPYGVLYSIEPDRVYILAIMHLHRRPDYWKHRR